MERNFENDYGIFIDGASRKGFRAVDTGKPVGYAGSVTHRFTHFRCPQSEKSDIDKGQQFWITEAKTGKRRKIALPRQLWLDLRSQTGSRWVFQNRLDERKHRSRQAVWKDVKRAQKAFRLPQNAGCHSMRKVYAVELMRKYGDIERVRRALNHDRPATTMIYAMADSLMEAKHRKPRRKA